jgi:hypothetical protein
MESISRRTFLQQTGTGAATVGAASAFAKIPFAGGKHRAQKSGPATHATAAAVKQEDKAIDGPLVVHIADPRTGRVSLMFGTREVSYHDPGLVARLLNAAR